MSESTAGAEGSSTGDGAGTEGGTSTGDGGGEASTNTAGDTGSAVNANANADAVAAAVAGGANDFGFVLDKYKADGRTDQEAAIEQAKAYGEINKKFSSFTGAPEKYELSLSEEMGTKFNLEDFKDDPLLQDFQTMASEMGINNDGANKFLDLFFKQQMANDAAIEGVRNEEMKLLGDNAQRRVENIESWGKANLDSDMSKALTDSLTSAGAVQAIEAVIAKSRNASQDVATDVAPAFNHEDLKKLRFAKDENGEDKMRQPEYKAMVDLKYEQLFGKEAHKTTVG